MRKKGHKGMMVLMVLMITVMAALYIHIMWINRPIKADVQASPAFSVTSSEADGKAPGQ